MASTVKSYAYHYPSSVEIPSRKLTEDVKVEADPTFQSLMDLMSQGQNRDHMHELQLKAITAATVKITQHCTFVEFFYHNLHAGLSPYMHNYMEDTLGLITGTPEYQRRYDAGILYELTHLETPATDIRERVFIPCQRKVPGLSNEEYLTRWIINGNGVMDLVKTFNGWFG